MSWLCILFLGYLAGVVLALLIMALMDVYIFPNATSGPDLIIFAYFSWAAIVALIVSLILHYVYLILPNYIDKPVTFIYEQFVKLFKRVSR